MVKFRVFLCFFLALLQTLPAANELAPDTTVMIPMRDGTELPADIYLPEPTAMGLPCILIRSPATRQADFAKAFAPLSKLGYAVVIQDTRSVLDTQGKTLPYLSDGWGVQQDGYDTVEWLAKCKYTNGKVGTAGMSALGITQLLMAPTNPPGLKCQYIGMAASSLYHHAIYPGGRILKNQVEGWLGLYARDPAVRNFVCDQNKLTDFWHQFDSTLVAEKVNSPALHYGGWYDTFLQGTLDAFTSRQEHGGPNAKGQQKLLIGPWTHLWPASTKLGDFDVPKAGLTPPIDFSPQHWFDYFLKGVQNGVDKIPAVTYYVMGTFDGSPSSGNVWRQTDKWPVPSVSIPFYLTADKTIVEKDAPAKALKFHYDHNVNDPVPTLGGRNLFIESGPKDQRSIEERKDVVTFTTAPLTEDMEVTGRIIAYMYVKSSEQNQDVVVRLSDVYPDGRSLLIADGIVHICPEPQQTSSEGIQEAIVDLWSTSMVFAKGHSIRVSISGSNYPKHEKIGHNIENFETVKNTLFVGEKTPSHIILPVVRRGETVLNKP